MSKWLALASLLGGCTFFATARPPGHDERCVTSRAARIADTVTTVLVAAFDLGAAVAIGTRHCGSDGEACLGLTWFAGGVSALAVPSVAGAIYGFSHGLCPDPVEERDEAASAALQAARTGDCLAAALLDRKVQGIDPRYRDTVLIQDAAIARCVQGRFLAACLHAQHPANGSGLDAGGAALAIFSPAIWNTPAPTTSCPTDRETATSFTATAIAAARAGDCSLPRRLSPVIEAIDPELHTELVREPATAACLAP